MNHLVLGASIPFAVGAVIFFVRGMRAGFVTLLLTPVLMAGFALWALVPDVPRVLGWMDLYHRLDKDPRCNVFLWHHSIDKVETASPWYAMLLVAMLVSLLFVAWRELCRAER